MGIFVDDPLMMLALLNSSVIQLFLLMITDERKWEVGYVRNIPIQQIAPNIKDSLEKLAAKGWTQSVRLNALDETQHLFVCLPKLGVSNHLSGWLTSIQADIQSHMRQVLTDEQMDKLEKMKEQ